MAPDRRGRFTFLPREGATALYGRIFDSLWSGSLCGKPVEQLVFIRLIAAKDECGIADIHPARIAADTGFPIEEVRKALIRLESPDPESRTPTMEGRRISRLDEHRDWGWMIVNAEHYNGIAKAEHARRNNAERQARWKERNANATVTPSNAPVTARRRHIDIEKDIPVEKKTTLSGKPDVGPCQTCVSGLRELNTLAGTNYRLTSKAALKAAHARHLEHGDDSVLTVVRHKCREWGRDPKMAKFLRPATLFRASNFAAYLDDAIGGNTKPAGAGTFDYSDEGTIWPVTVVKVGK